MLASILTAFLCVAPSARGVPAPNLRYRWFYLQTNFFVKEAVDRSITLIDRAANAGYNGLVFTDTKLQSLDPYPDFYRANVQRMLSEAAKKHIEVVPMVLPIGYADSMLARDPSLIESMPCRNVAFVAHGRALELGDRTNHFLNGDFESHNGDTFTGFAFQDGAGRASFADDQTRHGGSTSLRIQDPGVLAETQGNCRVMQKVKLLPWHQYRLSVWIKSDRFEQAGAVRAMVLKEDGKPLSFGDAGVATTQGWKRSDVVFNSQASTAGLVYLGVWGGTKGKLWFDDATIEDVGLLNVTRRATCALSILGSNGLQYLEGRDLIPISDPKFGNIPWAGEFDFSHDPPPVDLAPTTRIQDGQTVRMNYFAATYTDSNKTAICLGDPVIERIMRDEISRVLNLFQPKRIFFAHDEIRVMNWDDACQNLKNTPGELLARNVRSASKMALNTRPAATQFYWSDMFDPFHNSVDEYYLCNGSLQGSWQGLPKDAIIVNWNSGRAAQSLGFFHSKGFRQILAGYYDGPVDAIKGWLAAGVGKGVCGVMYTTWADRYDDLEAFAKAAWGQRAGTDTKE